MKFVTDKTVLNKLKFKEENYGKISIGNRLLLWYGVVRRFIIYIFNKKYVENNISKRSGKCLRCGSCCQLTFKKCPYLIFDTDGKSLCKIYNAYRIHNCRIFPIDKNDIKDRDAVSKKPCGYDFK